MANSKFNARQGLSVGSTPVDIIDSTGTITIPGTLIAGGSTGASGQVLTSTATGVKWDTAIAKPRVITDYDNTSITVDVSARDIYFLSTTLSAGTLTINAPTGTPYDGQKFTIKLKSTNIQTFAWNSVFKGSLDMNLPVASSGSGLEDYIGFIYDGPTGNWHLIAKVFGF